MIARYQSEKMRKLFSLENKFTKYKDIEIEVVKAWSELNVIPKEEAELVAKNAKVNLDRILELEAETKHDVIAFTRALSETLGNERKWVHYGLTSTDVVDSANALIYREANEELEAKLLKLKEALKTKALKYKKTPCIGRTHGIHADITSFGLKFLQYLNEIERHLTRFKLVRSEIETIKISGAVGNYANITPDVEKIVARNLKLNFAKTSTQVLPRDLHANYMSEIALIGTTLEKIATEIRLLQQTELREAEEYFSSKQKGSSAMPHKRNPIGSENICGCARVLRGYMLTSYENVSLWHERDISHSSTERIIIEDAVSLLDYMLNRMTNIIENLIVYEEQMLNNIYSTKGVIFAQRVMNKLIEEKKLTREEAYDIIQSEAIKAYTENLDFKNLLKNAKILKKYLNDEEIEACFDLEYYFKEIDTIYARFNL